MPRLQKILSAIGIASRRKAEELIREGRVTVNGRVAQIGDQADPERDHIKVNGKRVALPSEKVYIVLNKPKGVVTTAEDPEGRPTVMDLLKNKKPRVVPVGRLDFDAEGLLLLTNDGAMAYRLSHPSFRIPRIYHVKVKGKPVQEVIQKLSRGIFLEDGPTRPCRIQSFRQTAENAWVKMILHEGRNRQVKRMWEKMGHPVLKLKRMGFAGIDLGTLQTGRSRHLTTEEVAQLRKFAKEDALRNNPNASR